MSSTDSCCRAQGMWIPHSCAKCDAEHELVLLHRIARQALDFANHVERRMTTPPKSIDPLLDSLTELGEWREGK